ncbi:MAG TPA: DsrE/DsrF/DrsH-like family protein [Ktedonobacterales bacterium]
MTSSVTEPAQWTLPASVEQIIRDRVNELATEQVKQLVRDEVGVAMKKDPAKNTMAIIASKGTLDMAYPPLILASAGAAMGMDVEIFFTFYGLDIIKKGGAASLKVAPIANPAMPVPMPNIVGMLPGMTPMATWMMRTQFFAKHNVATVPDLLQQCVDLGVKLIGCQMTMDVMGIKAEDLIDGVEIGGAATFLNFASKAHTTLFV